MKFAKLGLKSVRGQSFAKLLKTMHVREADMREKCSFFNIVQKAFDPPPLSFEHHVVNFF